jgi:mannose-6-phosphate isomerase-like protein (cupin superfamily)
MKYFLANIEDETLKNQHYRKVLFTAKNSQLVLMHLQPGEEIGMETHELDQFIRFESGNGKVVIDGTEHSVGDGTAVVIPVGTQHNVVNTSKEDALKLYSLYSPPEHKAGTLHTTKQEADADADHHFDGRTSMSRSPSGASR